MSMQMRIHGDCLVGRGQDRDGPFSLRGKYDAESNWVSLDKAYPWLVVRYEGEWDGQMIHGISRIEAVGFFDTGTFEMWPLKDDKERQIQQEPKALPEPAPA